MGLGQAFKVVFGITVLNGVNGGFETFVNQAAGAGEYKLARIYLFRAMFISVITFLPCLLILVNTERFLVSVGQNPDVSRNA